MIDATTHTRKIWRSHFDGADSTIGGHKKLGQASNLYKVKIQKYTLCKFGFLQIRL
jgi:hypothetical protein